MNAGFWTDKTVLITGHTGFKGGWLVLTLRALGARVVGVSLPPSTEPSLFNSAQVETGIVSRIGDVRDLGAMVAIMAEHRPEVVFHLAAQPIVRLAYREPVETYGTNVMGTVHVLEAVRRCSSVRVAVVVTSDKCYENREWMWGYRENEELGGRDPYSSSKACAELVTAAYRDSYWSSDDLEQVTTAVATARAGNVIGGGDWAPDRIVPDAMRAFAESRLLPVRAPLATRPWQHVLEPLSGYLTLAERMWSDPGQFVGRWNFGPHEADARPVLWLVERLAALWGKGARFEQHPVRTPHEAKFLRLDCSKARSFLGWGPRLRVDEALAWVVDWYQAFYAGRDTHKLTLEQIAAYFDRPVLD